MKTRGSVLLGLACIALLLAPSAQAHKLTVKQAKAALTPIAEQGAPLVATKVAAKLPGSTVSKTRVDVCNITKKGHRADCLVIYSIVGGPIGNQAIDNTECVRNGRVEFRRRKSRAMRVSLPYPELFCNFSVPLDI